MKSKLLPISLFTLILGIATIILATGLTEEPEIPVQNGDSAKNHASEYFNKIRQNQITHSVDAIDELNAMEASNALALKSGNTTTLNWQDMGPDNSPGTIRALLFDNQNSESLILAGVTGGIWRTVNQGATWTKLNQANQNLKVTCMVQDNEGSIYVGTGNGFCMDDPDLFYSGIVGEGIFKSTDQDNFTLLEQTKPIPTESNDTVDFAYTYDLAFDNANNRIYSATNTGLWFSDDKGTTWNKVTRYENDSITYDVTYHIDSTIVCDNWYYDEETGELVMEGINELESTFDTLVNEKVESGRENNEQIFGKIECKAVKVASDGFVVATFDNKVYISEGETDPLFKNISSNPKNFDMFSKEVIYYTTNLTVTDTTNNTLERGQRTFTDATDDYDEFEDPNSPYSKSSQGRTQVAIAPSDENVLYATCSKTSGDIENVYLSSDKGLTWRIVFPGGSTSLVVFDETSCSNNVLSVFPDDPYKILLGGIDMWLGTQVQPTGYFDWGAGPITSGNFPGIYFYVPSGHHKYEFVPGEHTKIVVASDKGVSFGNFTSDGVEFQQIVRGLSNSQVYNMGISGKRHAFLAGIEAHGVQYISGTGNSPQTGVNISPFEFTNISGGSCKVSAINQSVFIISDLDARINRTGDQGESYSLNFTLPNSLVADHSVVPFAMWESINDQQAKTTVKFKANKTYYKGDVLSCRSAIKGVEGGNGYPFSYVLEEDSLVQGDSIYVKDIVQNKFFIAGNDAIFLTRDMLKLDSIITYDNSIINRVNVWKIAKVDDGTPTCLALSSDANYCFVGTDNGRIIRIANIQAASDMNTGDVDNPFCVIAYDQFVPDAFAGRYITSIAVDQKDPSHIMVTLGNYGNTSYVYQAMNALDEISNITLTDITGNDLPKMPVYSSVIEMNNSNIGIIGTELGVYSTQNLSDAVPIWEFDASGIGKAMVVKLEQQTTYKDREELQGPDPSVPPLVYEAVDNWGDIYCATFGRGVFRDETFNMPVAIEEHPESNGNMANIDLKIFPNPIDAQGTVSFYLPTKQNITIQIFNISGQSVKQIKLNELSGGVQAIPFNCADMIDGIYILRLEANGQFFNSKFIVK